MCVSFCVICLICMSIFTCSLSFSPQVLSVSILAPSFEALAWGRQWLKLGKFLRTMKPFTMPHPTLITPRNLLMLASSIAPYPSKYSGSLRLHHHSRAQRAAAFRRPPRGLVAMLHPNDGYEWTLGLEKWALPCSSRRRFVFPSQLGHERPSCQGDRPQSTLPP